MTMAAFGDVTYETPVDASAPAHDEAQVDINDPRLSSEDITINQSADAYEFPPPAPDGKWRAKLRQVDVKDKAGVLHRFLPKSYPNMQNGKPFLVTNVESKLIDLSGPFDGTTIIEYHVKTIVEPRKSTSSAATIVLKAGGTLSGNSDKAQMDSLLKVLASEPEVIVETVWRASCQPCQEKAKNTGGKNPGDFLLGMHRFPQLKNGIGHDPLVACPLCKAVARAQIKVQRYWSVKEQKADRGL